MKIEVELSAANLKKLESVKKEYELEIDSFLINLALNQIDTDALKSKIAENLKTEIEKALSNKSNLAKLAKALKK